VGVFVSPRQEIWRTRDGSDGVTTDPGDDCLGARDSSGGVESSPRHSRPGFAKTGPIPALPPGSPPEDSSH